MRFVIVPAVAGDDCKTVVNGRRGNDEVRLRESVSCSPAFLNQNAPFQHDVFGDWENPLVKHRTHLVCEPVIQLGAARGFDDKLDAESNLGKGYHADVKLPRGQLAMKATTAGSGI